MVSVQLRSIRGRLAALGLCQYDLAAVLGISQGTLNPILTGRRPAPDGFETRAARALDLLERAELAGAEARASAITEAASSAERDKPADEVDVDALPEVLFADDVAALLRCSRSTLERRVRARVFPLAPIHGVDKRPRWSKVAVLQWLAVGGPSGRPVRRRRRRTA